MDPELREYLEQRFATIEQRMATTATKADVDAIQQQLNTLEVGQQHLEARIDAQGRDLREGHAAIIQRIDEGFAARKEDEDLALRKIERVEDRVRKLERRVDVLEQRA